MVASFLPFVSRSQESDIISETARGKMLQAEMGAYPLGMVSLLINGKDTLTLNMNFEDYQGLSQEDIFSSSGKEVSVTYDRFLELSVMDIYHDATSLLGEYAMDNLADFKKHSGILHAIEVTESDLPGEFGLELDNGSFLYFSYYVTEEMVAVNGKRVTIYWLPHEQKMVREIRF